MHAVKISENVYWVGAIDWNLRSFHGYLTPRGSTYNAYLIIDKKITLIDTVKHYLSTEMIERIKSIVDPSKIDYIISNHVEMDHSGAITSILELAPNATVVASPQGVKGLQEHYKSDWKFHTVKTGDTLSIGDRTFQFVQTPMIHWPDNMVTYSPFDKILFSNDSFGQHVASFDRFDDELGLSIAVEEAQKYYGNIVLSYNSQVQKELEAASKLDIKIIAPSHGIIWRSHVKDIIEKYTKWASNTTDPTALIIYDTMWNSTELMAQAIAKGFDEKNIKTKIYNLSVSHISDIMSDVVTSRYIYVGSSTLNSNLLPTVAGFLTYLRSLSPGKRIARAFGSYGWGGQSVAQIQEYLEQCDFQVQDPIKVKYIPDQDTLNNIAKTVQDSL